jgi:hypothetical protein
MKAWALLLLLSAPAPSATPEKAAVAADRPSERAADRTPVISERVKDIPRHDGFLPFYWDARKGQLLLEILPGGGEFLYGPGLAGGAGTLDVSLDRGQLGDLGVCRFERAGPRVLLHQRQTTHPVSYTQQKLPTKRIV